MRSITIHCTRRPASFHVARRPPIPVLVAGLVLTATLAGCSPPAASPGGPPPITEAEHGRLIETWQAKRAADLRQPDGWLSLVGLMWLEEGANTFGSDPSNNLVYAGGETPERLGTFSVEGETVRFEGAPGLHIRVVDSEEEVGSIIVRHPAAEEGGEPRGTPVLAWGPLRWQVIRRLEQFAVRLKDESSPTLVEFEGLESFPTDRAWRLGARFEAYDPPRTIGIPNALGNINETESPGAIVFEVDGEEHRIDVWFDSEAEDGYFTVFGDTTNRETTYGGGRFLWIDLPDELGRTVVDFNRAYNPPCVFTDYATCPLPPEQNKLPIAIEAGERMYRGVRSTSH
jgi:uncharacterized protein (DUF1684 family)